MKNTVAICIAVAIACSSFAQSDAKLFANTEDYKTGNAVTEPVIIIKRSAGSIAMTGGSDYKICSDEYPKLGKELRKEYFLVERNDSLFVNFKQLGGKWYGLTFYRNDDYAFFIGGASKLQNSDEATVMFGAVGGLATAGITYNYVLDLKKNKTLFVSKDFMKEFLGEKSELYQFYRKEEYPYSTETVQKYIDAKYK